MRKKRLTLTIACIGALMAILPAQARVAEPTREPVKVHGHWTIEVYNRDGTFASRHEFENALTPNGAQLIADILAGKTNFGLRIFVTAVEPGLPPCKSGLSATPDVCVICQPGDGIWFASATSIFNNLVATATGGTLVMIGKIDIANTTAIGLVISSYSNSTGWSSGDFATTSTFGLTRALLATPIPVEAGQTVRVRVEISFT